MPSRRRNVAGRLTLRLWLAVVLGGSLYAYCATIAWSDGMGSSFVRAAVAVFGMVWGYVSHRMSVGTRLRTSGRVVGHRFRHHPLSEYMIVPVAIGVLAAILFPVTTRCGDGNAREQASALRLKRCGLAMLQYAQDHDEMLPPQMGTDTLRNSLTVYQPPSNSKDDIFQDPASGRPFVWRQVLGGLRVSDVKSADKVIVAYSQPYAFRTRQPERSVLFLDGHVKCYTNVDFWKIWSEQPPLPEKPKHTDDRKSIKKKP
jgi:type II secretory pathway pseudopilin PulG